MVFVDMWRGIFINWYIWEWIFVSVFVEVKLCFDGRGYYDDIEEKWWIGMDVVVLFECVKLVVYDEGVWRIVIDFMVDWF